MTLDQKSRLTVPARYRELLVAEVNGQMVVTKNHDGCLSLFPLPVWEKYEAELNAMPSEFEGWRRLYIGSATDVDIDSAARVLIPAELRQWAGLERDRKSTRLNSSHQ